MRLNKASALMALFLSILLPLGQVHASQMTLDSALNELQYALTVEWDQKDAAFQSAALEKFTAQINELKKQGMTNAEIVEGLKSKALDAKSVQDVERIAQLAKSKSITEKEMARMVRDAVTRNVTQGASWSGDTTGVILVSLVMGLIIVALVMGAPVYVTVNDCYDYDYDGYCY